MIKLVDTSFTLIPEGPTVFKITEVEYNETFGKMAVTLQTKSGAKQTERFLLLKNTGEVNEGAQKAFSYFAKTAMNNYSLDAIDEQDLVGCYIKATVKHEQYESTKNPGKMMTACRLNKYEVALGFEGAEEAGDAETDAVDLDAFLND